MKIIIMLPALIYSLVATGQNNSIADTYTKAKEIIKDASKIVTPYGIQENYEVNIGGVKQWVFARGVDSSNPVILFVHGGPASPMAPVMWLFQKPLEEYFTVIQYDQRAAGKSYLANDTDIFSDGLHISQYVADAIELSELIKGKYNKQKIILIGHSWGTIVSMYAALKRPDLFYAYVGIGQVINTMDNEQVSYDYAVKEATRLHNDSAMKELASIAPYPGKAPLTRERIIIARKWPQYYGGLSAYRTNSNYFFNAPLLSPEYTARDINAIDEGNLFTLDKILPEFLKVDFKTLKNFPIPVFMLMGRHDYTTPSNPTAAWLQGIKAPIKKGIWFENSAHLIPLEEPGKMLVTLLKDVRPLALEKRPGRLMKSKTPALKPNTRFTTRVQDRETVKR